MALNALTSVYTDSEEDDDVHSDDETRDGRSSKVEIFSQPVSRQSTPASVHGSVSGAATPIEPGIKSSALVPYMDITNNELNETADLMDTEFSAKEGIVERLSAPIPKDSSKPEDHISEDEDELHRHDIREQISLEEDELQEVNEKKRMKMEESREDEEIVEEEVLVDGIFLPPEPKQRCSKDLEAFFADLFEKKRRGIDPNASILQRKDFRNPSLYEKLISYCQLEEFGTNFPPELYDPTRWGSESYYDELGKAQKADMERREKERQRTKVEVIAGTAKKLTSTSTATAPASVPGVAEERKRSKWDQVGTNPAQAAILPPPLLTTAMSGTKAMAEIPDRGMGSLNGVNESLGTSVLNEKPEEELMQAKLVLEKQAEELAQLRNNRTRMESEVQDLTASLFEQANKMVNDAAMDKFLSEKSLKEARLQIEGLQAEVTALKTLVLTSTPSNPNLSPSHCNSGFSSPSKLFRNSKRGHQKCASQGSVPHGTILQLAGESGLSNLCCDHDCKRGRGKRRSVCRSQSGDLFRCDENSVSDVWNGVDEDDDDVAFCDPLLLQAFKQWWNVCKEPESSPVVSQLMGDNDGNQLPSFLKAVLEQEINPCLAFPNISLTSQVREAMRANAVIIECRTETGEGKRECPLLETKRKCDYLLRLCDSDAGVPISELCRNRITAVCDFLNYLKYIQTGLVKASDEAAFQEVTRLRKNMSLAKLGCKID
ncbi:unnamed protein product [Notodromas monacha]|uniref:GDP/GTP exchange factor Sec2 N-terminal domain-containing protein n=1 Tax=Notodromas monacha TaxID=399045 RepID=A0A7R9BUG7_9CRUS|nr:unnamed protein product [Notodromas monacha]CAG0920889.1 unnamed protein product [Notodromas monacha]